MSSRSQRAWSRRSVVGVLVGVLVLLLLVGVALVNRFRAGEPEVTAEPSYRENRVVVTDTFQRTVDRGWGEADTGGPYAVSHEEDFSVAGGIGSIALPKPGLTRTASLAAVRSSDLDVSFDLLAPRTSLRGSGAYVALQLRANGTSFYRATLRFSPDRRVFLSMSRYDGSEDARVALLEERTVASKVQQGQRLQVRVSISGATPVQLRTSVRTGAEPPTELTGTDSSASRLIAGGPLTFWAYLSGGSDAGCVVGVDNLNVSQLLRVPAGGNGTAAGASSEEAGASLERAGRRPDGVLPRTAAGAAEPTTTSYPVPVGALFVSPGGAAAASGTSAEPYGSIQDAVDAAPDGATVVLRAGTYHESVLLPVGRQLTLQPYPEEEVWLDGSSAVTGWRRSGAAWTVPWRYDFDSSPTYTKGAKDLTDPGWNFVNPSFPMAAHPDQVWLGGDSLTQVGSRRQVTEGTFYVDRRNRRLVLGSDPTGVQVRASTLSKALTIVGAGDVVRGIGVRRYATSVWQLGAATVNNAGVSLENMVFVDNATTGLSVFAADVTLSGITAVRNGLMGVHANQADRLDATDIWSGDNNTEHFNRAPSAGGMKLTSSRGVRVADSEFTGNEGHGLWFDASSYDLQIAGNRSEGNTGAGLVVEISSRVVVVNNVLVDNGLHGLWVIDTDRAEIANNTLARNAGANLVLVTDGRDHARPGHGGIDPRRPDDPDMVWVTRDVDAYNNVLADSGSCAVCVLDHTGTRTADELRIGLDNNYYAARSTTAAPFAQWAAGRSAPENYADFGSYRASTGQDGASVWSDGPAVTGRGELGAEVQHAGPQVARPLSRAAADAAGAGAGTLQLGAWRG